MFAISQPTASLVSTDLDYRLQMQYNFSIPPSESRGRIIGRVLDAADEDENGILKNVVICCHGSPAHLHIGLGFGRSQVEDFEYWAGKVEKIWIIACNVARIREPNGMRDGNLFCSEIARYARCYVLAPTEVQTNRYGLYPFGELPNYEGLLLGYRPHGNVVYSRRYRSDTWYYSAEPYCRPVS